MHFSLATVLTIVPLLASASPFAQQPPLIKLPLSKKSNLHLPDGSVNVRRLGEYLASSNPKFGRSLHNHERKTGKDHLMQPKVAKRIVGIDPLDDEQDEGTGHFWTAIAYVGSPEVQFTMVPSTESGDFLLPAKACDSTCSGHTSYDPSASKSAKPLGNKFTLSYSGDDSAASGDLYTDTVTIAGLTATTQTLGAATHYGSELSLAKFAADGILGLGFTSKSSFGAPNFVNNLYAQTQIPNGVFSFKFVREKGELTIGGLDTDSYTGLPYYTPVTLPGSWVVTFTSLMVGPASIGGATAYLRAGNPFTAGPKTEISTVYSQIPGSQDASSTLGAGIWTFPCDANIPIIYFTFGDGNSVTEGKEVIMSADSFNFGPIAQASDTCMGTMMAGQDDNAWYLGDSFLRNIYTIFDYDYHRVGFATLPTEQPGSGDNGGKNNGDSGDN